MENTLLVRFDRLALIDPASIPRARREELARSRPDDKTIRRAAVGSIASVFFTGFAAFAYAILSAFAWIGAAPVFGSGLAVFAAIMTVIARSCWRTYARERKALAESPPATPRLIGEAAAEQALDEAARELNAQATAWNEAAELARTHAVSDALARGIDAQRRLLAGRMEAFRLRLRRFNFLTGPRPKLLPPPSDWGHVVPVSLASP